jgi:hypothetical protein
LFPCQQNKVPNLERFLKAENTPFEILGKVTGSAVVVDGENWGAVSDWKRTYDTVLGDIMA